MVVGVSIRVHIPHHTRYRQLQGIHTHTRDAHIRTPRKHTHTPGIHTHTRREIHCCHNGTVVNCSYSVLSVNCLPTSPILNFSGDERRLDDQTSPRQAWQALAHSSTAAARRTATTYCRCPVGWLRSLPFLSLPFWPDLSRFFVYLFGDGGDGGDGGVVLVGSTCCSLDRVWWVFGGAMRVEGGQDGSGLGMLSTVQYSGIK